MARRSPQLEFAVPGFVKPRDAFGGSLLKGNPRSARPLESKLPIHLTLRARRSVLRLPKSYAIVEALIEKTTKKYGVKKFEHANVGNHLHILLQINTWLWPKFIRELTGRIAQTLGEKGIKIEGGLWLYRPHTRIVRSWRLAFRSAKAYVQLNQLEAEGHLSRAEIKSLKELRAIWADG
jgi:REP element-mobilizing transposase RayT